MSVHIGVPNKRTCGNIANARQPQCTTLTSAFGVAHGSAANNPGPKRHKFPKLHIFWLSEPVLCRSAVASPTSEHAETMPTHASHSAQHSPAHLVLRTDQQPTNPGQKCTNFKLHIFWLNEPVLCRSILVSPTSQHAETLPTHASHSTQHSPAHLVLRTDQQPTNPGQKCTNFKLHIFWLNEPVLCRSILVSPTSQHAETLPTRGQPQYTTLSSAFGVAHGSAANETWPK